MSKKWDSMSLISYQTNSKTNNLYKIVYCEKYSFLISPNLAWHDFKPGYNPDYYNFSCLTILAKYQLGTELYSPMSMKTDSFNFSSIITDFSFSYPT